MMKCLILTPMQMKCELFIIFAFSSLYAFGQTDDYIHYNYKSRYDLIVDSVRHYYQQEDYERAAKYFDQLDLWQDTYPETFYIHGITIYKKRGMQAAMDSLKLVCAQKMLALYDIRLLRWHDNNNKAVANRKLHDYFALMHDMPDEHARVFRLYHEFFQDNAATLERYNMVPYAYLARQMQEKNEITEDEFESIINRLHAAIEAQPEQSDYIEVKQHLDKIALR